MMHGQKNIKFLRQFGEGVEAALRHFVERKEL